MAQRDYVKKKSKVKNTSRLIPNLMMAIAVILVILFVAILYFLSTNKTNKQQLPTVITEKPQTTLPDKPEERWTYLKELENPDSSNNSNSQQTTPSSQEKERQQILDNFTNDKTTSSTVIAQSGTVSTTNQTVPSKTEQASIADKTKVGQVGSLLLQCGAFKDKANAESLKAKLAMSGVPSFVKSDNFYRVFAGPYESKTEAEKAIATLKINGITSCILSSK